MDLRANAHGAPSGDANGNNTRLVAVHDHHALAKELPWFRVRPSASFR